VPLATTLTSILLAIKENEKVVEIIKYPTLPQIQVAESIHVFAFTANGDLLVAESEGEFDMDGWDEVFEEAKRVCSGTEKRMDESGTDKSGAMAQFVKNTMQEKAQADVHWKK
jgi:exosome complex component RRP46